MLRSIALGSLALFFFASLLGCERRTPIAVTDQEIAKLQLLLAQPKFEADELSMYPGAPSEAIRVRCELVINDLLRELIRGLPRSPSEAFVFQRFREALVQLDGEDSEERDRALLYLEQILAILDIDGSSGLLNRWRYGFEPS